MKNPILFDILIITDHYEDYDFEYHDISNTTAEKTIFTTPTSTNKQSTVNLLF